MEPLCKSERTEVNISMNSSAEVYYPRIINHAHLNAQQLNSTAEKANHHYPKRTIKEIKRKKMIVINPRLVQTKAPKTPIPKPSTSTSDLLHCPGQA
jgi:hypothetical protein